QGRERDRSGDGRLHTPDVSRRAPCTRVARSPGAPGPLLALRDRRAVGPHARGDRRPPFRHARARAADRGEGAGQAPLLARGRGAARVLRRLTLAAGRVQSVGAPSKPLLNVQSTRYVSWKANRSAAPEKCPIVRAPVTGSGLSVGPAGEKMWAYDRST